MHSAIHVKPQCLQALALCSADMAMQTDAYVIIDMLAVDGQSNQLTSL